MILRDYIMILLVVGLAFGLIASVITDFEQEYPSVDVDTSTWTETYDYSERINGSMAITQRLLEQLGEEDVAWFKKVGSGLGVIFVAIPEAVAVVLKTGTYGTDIITALGKDVGLPDIAITISITALILFIIFALIAFIHKSRI